MPSSPLVATVIFQNCLRSKTKPTKNKNVVCFAAMLCSKTMSVELHGRSRPAPRLYEGDLLSGHPHALQAVQSIRYHRGPYEVCRDGPPYAEPIMPALGCPNDELSGSGATGGRSPHRTDNPHRFLPPISASPCCQMSCGCRG